MVGTKHNLPSWMSAAASRVELDGNVSTASDAIHFQGREGSRQQPNHNYKALSDFNLGFGERALSAAGAAVLSAILVNPLDVAKTRLQAQAAGVPYQAQCHVTSFHSNPLLREMRCAPSCAPDCYSYSGTFDVFYKVTRQEGFSRLWRGTNASLALAVPTVGIYLPCYDIFRNRMEEFTTQNAPNLTPYVPLVAGSLARSLACITCYPVELARTRMQAFKETRSGIKPPGVWKTLLGVTSPVYSANNVQNLQTYRLLWTGFGAQLARDVPFSAICWAALEPVRRRILGLVDDFSAASVIGANFAAGFIAGSLAAAATCPLDVSKTRRQIEKDPARALNMTTRTTLVEIWRNGGIKGMFTGIGPRVARAGPSVGIVVSFYEVVKYALFRYRYLED